MASCLNCRAVLTEQQIAGGICTTCGASLPSGKDASRVSARNRETIDVAAGLASDQPARTMGGSENLLVREDGTSETIEFSSDSLPNDVQGIRATADNFDETVQMDGSKLFSPEGRAEDTRADIHATVDLDQQKADTIRTLWAGAVQSDDNPLMSFKGQGPSLVEALPFCPSKRQIASQGAVETDPSDYQLEKFLAEGGMGRVYVAKQTAMRRSVALKELKSAYAKDDDRRSKFMAEATITGELEHPNIVPVYDLGVDQDGNLFYSMKRVSGKSWQDLIEDQSLKEKLNVLMRVADALAYAHSRGIIHRDIKPENIMLGAFGEVLVMDWGLAVRLGGNEKMPVAGTPAYMSPEMAIGDDANIGVRSDVYLMGASLYQIILGHPPHRAKNVFACIRAARANVLMSPEDPDELFSIVERAMATDPADRYSSVVAFQDAINTYLEHAESIALAERAERDLNLAKTSGDNEAYSRALFGLQDAISLWSSNEPAQELLQETRIAYASNACEKGNYDLGLSLVDENNPKEHPLWLELSQAAAAQVLKDKRLKTMRLAALVLAVGTVTAIGWGYTSTKTKNIELADTNSKLTETIGKLDQKTGQLSQSNSNLQKSEKKANENAKEAVRLQILASEEAGKAVFQADKAAKARDVADGLRIVADKHRVSAESSKREAEYGQFVSEIALSESLIEQNDSASAAELLNELYCRTPDLCGWEWNRLYYQCHTEIGSVQAGESVLQFASSPTSNLYAVIVEVSNTGNSQESEQVLQIRETGIQEPVHVLPLGTMDAKSIAISTDGQFIVVGGKAKGDDTVLLIWNSNDNVLHRVSAKEFVGQILGTQDPASLKSTLVSIYTPRLSPQASGQRLLVGYSLRSPPKLNKTQIAIFDVNRQCQINKKWISPSLLTVTKIADWSPDGKHFLTVENRSDASKSRLNVWDISRLQATPLPIPGQKITTARFSPSLQSPSILYGTNEGSLFLWDWSKAKRAGDGSQASQNFTPTLLGNLPQAVRQIGFCEDGNLVITAIGERSAWLWDLSARQSAMHSAHESNRGLLAIRGHEGEVHLAGFVAGGQLVTADDFGVIRNGEPQQFRNQLTFSANDRIATYDCDLSQDKYLATASSDGTTCVLNVMDRTPTTTKLYVGHTQGKNNIDRYFVRSVNNQSGLRIASYSGEENTACLWDHESSRQVKQRTEAANGDIVISPDGRYLFSGGRGDPAQMWDLKENRSVPHDIPDGLSVLAVSKADPHLIFAGMMNGRGKLLNQRARELSSKALHNDTIIAALFSASGQRLYTADKEGELKIWRIGSSEIQSVGAPIQISGKINQLAVFEDSDVRYLFAWQEEGNKSGPVTVVNLNTSRPEQLPGTYLSLAILPGLKHVVALRADKRLALWKFTPSELQSRQLPDSIGRLIAKTSPKRLRSCGDRRLLTYGIVKRRLQIRSWQFSNKPSFAAPKKFDSGSPVRLSRFINRDAQPGADQLLLAVSEDGIVRQWKQQDRTTFKVVAQTACRSHSPITTAVASSDGQLAFLAGGNDLFAVDLRENLAVRQVRVQNPSVIQAIAWQAQKESPTDKGMLAVLSSDKKVSFWQWQNGQLKQSKQMVSIENASASVALSSDGYSLAVGGKDGAGKGLVQLWKRGQEPNAKWSSNGQQICHLRRRVEVTSLVFSESGTRLIVGDDGGRLAVWQTNAQHDEQDKFGSPHELMALRGHFKGILSARFSPNDDELLTTTRNGVATIWPARQPNHQCIWDKAAEVAQVPD